MFNVEYELLPKSVWFWFTNQQDSLTNMFADVQMFSKNRDIHSHDSRYKNLLMSNNWYKELYLSQRQNMKCYSF